MLETMFGLSTSSALGMIGILAAIVSIITEVLKKIVPRGFSTKVLVMIISLVITLSFALIFCTIDAKIIVFGVIGSFVVAFISMYGWDTFKEIVTRYKCSFLINKGDENGE